MQKRNFSLQPIILGTVLVLCLGAESRAAKPGAKAGALRPPETTRLGDPAPEFALGSLDGKSIVRLSEIRGSKPLVLIFGSYTCPPFRDVYPALERLHGRYGERVGFYYIYIREAHPEDGWKMPRNQRDGITIGDPKSIDERHAVASQACAHFKTRIPALVDTMDDAANRAYAAWPSRLFLVDETGRLVVHGAPGPAGLVPAAKAVESWLKARYAN
jgi:thiol-disulfide isomerase/thioredoxin